MASAELAGEEGGDVYFVRLCHLGRRKMPLPHKTGHILTTPLRDTLLEGDEVVAGADAVEAF